MPRSTGGSQVDRVDAGTSANDQRQPGAGLNRRSADLRRTHDQDVVVGNGRRQRFGVQFGVARHLAAQRFELFDRRYSQFVSNQNLHLESPLRIIENTIVYDGKPLEAGT
ncbi:MAG: hypothetical protein QM739_11875 [Propionivibrio sp.]